MLRPSIHDSRIVSYEVDGEMRRIVFHTRFEEGTASERADVIFESVLAYRFERDDFGNILFGIDEVGVRELVEENRVLFESESKYAWPGFWNTSPESSIEYFESKGARAFVISASLGLEGWVVAASCKVEVTP